MKTLIFRALVLLFVFDLLAFLRGFRAVHLRVANCPVRKSVRDDGSVGRVCKAISEACIWYPKKVQCLQRSAVMTCLLRRHGVNARMLIGARRIPFASHAWVEVNGAVIGDKADLRSAYGLLDMC